MHNLTLVTFLAAAATTLGAAAAAAATSDSLTNLSDVKCGKIARGSRRFHARIKGGMRIPVSEFPHAVSIRKAGGHHCGGSLVRK